jgi:hypothetical protein
MKFVYLDKKDRFFAWFTSRRSIVLAAIAVILALLPLRKESSIGYFTLEPVHRAVIRTTVPGTVTDVYASEGKWIAAGAPLVRLRNLALDSRVARTQANYSVAAHRTASATMRYAADLGPAREERAQLAQQLGLLTSEAAELQINSPISGLVLTPRLSDWLGSYVPAGTELAEVADVSPMRARIYMSEHDISKFWVGSGARLLVQGIFGKWDGRVSNIEPMSSEIPLGLTETSQYKGLHPPKFYAVDLMVFSPEGKLKPGMVGTARVYGNRRSLAGFGWQELVNFLGRRMW